MTLLNLNQVATTLNISKASVKNWEKQGYLKEVDTNLYSPKDVDDLKNRLKSGDLKRLITRANKLESKTKFIPTEYIHDGESIDQITRIVDFIYEYNIRPEQAIFLLSINLLSNNGEFKDNDLQSVVRFDNLDLFRRENIYKELSSWYKKISNRTIDVNNKYCNFLLTTNLPDANDLLGIIYQSIIHEGKKSKLGSYYTPVKIVNNLLQSPKINYSKVLDPCCGTGQFLLKMAEKVNTPESLWGADIDPIAVQIARINILMSFDGEFSPNIYNLNSLLDLHEEEFTFIATNPPWGAKINNSDLKLIKQEYSDIKSKESFSFFLNMAIKKLGKGGYYSFVLPESLLYVKNHMDIRSVILNNSAIESINYYGRIFKKVFSPVVTIEGVKENPSKEIEIKSDTTYYINQDRFLSNHNLIMDIFCTEKDQKIIDKIYSKPYKTLENNSKWALGIVTGNNSKHLKDISESDLEPIFRGREVEKLKLKAPQKFIHFNKELFQQCAPEEFYRSDEKLIYKFISNNLCFAYDSNKSLTLNSANILIPTIDNYSVKVVGAFLNSKIYNFIIRKKIKPLKILRGDLETLPFPILKSECIKDIENLVDNFVNSKIEINVLDNYIYSIFELEKEEINHIEDSIQNKT